MPGWSVGRGSRLGVVADPPYVDPADIPGFGLPTWRDESADRLAYKLANPTLHPINPAQWNVRTQANFGLTFDAAIPTAENVIVDAQGHMVQLGTWLPTPQSRTPVGGGPSQLTHQTGYVDHRNYNSGDVSRSTRYGRWEIRAKVGSGLNTRGSLNAFWLRNGNTGEIDMMESWGYGGTMSADYIKYMKNRSTFTTFQNTTTAAGKTFYRIEQELGIPQSDPVSAAYHTTAFEWTPDYMAIFRDGLLVKRILPTDTVAESSGNVSASKYWTDPAYNSPWHLRVNLHVGPNASYWGLPDPANRQWTIDPIRYEIDYVRMWAL